MSRHIFAVVAVLLCACGTETTDASSTDATDSTSDAVKSSTFAKALKKEYLKYLTALDAKNQGKPYDQTNAFFAAVDAQYPFPKNVACVWDTYADITPPAPTAQTLTFQKHSVMVISGPITVSDVETDFYTLDSGDAAAPILTLSSGKWVTPQVCKPATRPTDFVSLLMDEYDTYFVEVSRKNAGQPYNDQNAFFSQVTFTGTLPDAVACTLSTFADWTPPAATVVTIQFQKKTVIVASGALSDTGEEHDFFTTDGTEVASYYLGQGGSGWSKTSQCVP